MARRRSQCPGTLPDAKAEVCLWEPLLHNRIIVINHSECDDPENSNTLLRRISSDHCLGFLPEAFKFRFPTLYGAWEFQKVSLQGFLQFHPTVSECWQHPLSGHLRGIGDTASILRVGSDCRFPVDTHWGKPQGPPGGAQRPWLGSMWL